MSLIWLIIVFLTLHSSKGGLIFWASLMITYFISEIGEKGFYPFCITLMINIYKILPFPLSNAKCTTIRWSRTIALSLLYRNSTATSARTFTPFRPIAPRAINLFHRFNANTFAILTPLLCRGRKKWISNRSNWNGRENYHNKPYVFHTMFQGLLDAYW